VANSANDLEDAPAQCIGQNGDVDAATFELKNGVFGGCRDNRSAEPALDETVAQVGSAILIGVTDQNGDILQHLELRRCHADRAVPFVRLSTPVGQNTLTAACRQDCGS